ncbi:hypothetical protein CAPTEDRAFT_145523 [Capitella teleta]|uniref:Fucosyltransferase n=1 Tax=Capitella teleta TaxID=283909 RepID=R7UQE1_CAPTE|nr:hypothetical protein CAPTEDRAFT_145523 [Capitella teleta]|eukprot:ELU05616.1 hypothetical protein CAPTEDRAFT_145523 [Capitella teleta]
MNLTITYAPDSDIKYEMYGVTCNKTTKQLNPENYAASKKNAALWIVGNCLCSGRMAYVKELQKHYPVDIYGHCGKKEICREAVGSQMRSNCISDFLEKYKFYLAFENSYCENYYTEKVVKTTRVKTIPVVLGLPNYTEIFGAGTHVNARDFPSPKDLATHLHKLSDDDEAYNGIMRQKLHMKCTHNYQITDMFCDLCKTLHNRIGQRHTVPDVRTIWGVKENCVNPREFFKDIGGSAMGDFKISPAYALHDMK